VVQRIAVLVLATAVLAVGPARVGAQQASLVTTLIAAEYGAFGADVGGSSVQVYRIPISFKLRDEDDRRWGLRLSMPVSLAGNELRASTSIGEFVERVNTVTAYPGMEVRLPFGERWLVRPYVEVGVITAFGDAGSEEVLSLGSKWRVELGGRTVQWRLGGEAKLSAGKLPDGSTNDFMVWELGGESSFPLGFDVSGLPADVAPYAIFRRFSGLEFDLPGDTSARVERQWELGLTFGTEPRHRVWGIRLPRFGIAHRFGDGLPGWRIVFGFPF
jgi:hypothetical protein